MSTIDSRLVVRMEATLTKFERQMDRARIKAQQTSTGIEDRFDKMNTRMGASSTKAAGAMTRLLNVSGSGRFVLQNTAAQIGDIAVQLEAGTSPARVMAQQLPQIFGGFGALGGALGIVAPLLGTVLAVGIPVVAMLGTMAGNSEEAAAEVSKLGALNLSGARSEIKSLADLQERYTKAVNVHRVAQTEASAAAVAALETEFEAQVALLDLQQIRTQQSLRATQATLQGQRDELKKILEDVRREAEASIMATVGDPEGQRRRNEAIARAIGEALDRNQDLVLSIREGEAQASLLELAVAEVAKALDAAKGNADGLAGIGFGNISSAANEAARLAENLGISVGQARLYMRLRDNVGQRDLSSIPLDPRDPRYDPVQAEFRRLQESATVSTGKPDRPTGGRSGGGKADQPFFGATDREIEAMRLRLDLLGKSSAEVARLTAEHRLLEEAKTRGLDLDARQAATGQTLREEIARQAQTIGDLAAQYDRAQERTKFFDAQQRSVKDGMLDAIVAGEGLAGTLETVARSFARAAFEAALFNSGPFASGNSSGLLGGLFGGLLGGARAGGGPVQAGVPYLVNENTPRSEIMVPSRSGAVLSVPQAQAALRGAVAGAGSVGGRIVVEVVPSPLFRTMVRSEARDISVQTTEAGLRSYDSAAPARQQAIRERGV